ncbi:MAG: M17 family peptidase N-terminal domain-containing protein [Ignavibacteriota bacterium]
MTRIREFLAIWSLALAVTTAGAAQAQPAQIQIADGPIPVRVLAQGPADTTTDLQAICLFRSDPANTLHGSLAEMNDKLKGLLVRIRTQQLFRGELGETLLIAPQKGTIPAKRLLLIGLGDSETFTLQRMELVGSILYREAGRLGVAHPFFAPTLLDGGVSKYTTGAAAEQVLRGFLRGAATEKALPEANATAGTAVQDLTYLAGPQHASDTRDGIEKAFAAAK